MKKVGKILVAAIAAVTALVSVAMFAACGGETGTAEKTVKYHAVNYSGSHRDLEGLGTMVTTTTGDVLLYDDGTYLLETTNVGYATWGSTTVVQIIMQQYGTYTEGTADEFGVFATLSAPTRTMCFATGLGNSSMWNAGEGQEFDSAALLKDTDNLSENDKALFENSVKSVGRMANYITESISIEINFETSMYTVS